MRRPRGIPIPPSESLKASTSFAQARRPSSNESGSLSTANILGLRPSNSLDKSGFSRKRLSIEDLFATQSDASDATGVVDLKAIDRFFDSTQSAFTTAFTPAPINTDTLTDAQNVMIEKTRQATTRLTRVTQSVAELQGGLSRVQDRITEADRNIALSQKKAQALSYQMEWMKERLEEVEGRREMSIRMMIINAILLFVGYISRTVIAVRNFVLAPVHFVQQKFERRAAAAEPHKEERRPLRRSDDKKDGLRKMGEINLFASTGELPIVPAEIIDDSPLGDK